ncbi:MAG: M15 family metallopeptidase [Bacteroidia bacterium]|nr:M15 family metallopeptidase [Bacteroidia bacterium]
MNAIRKGDKGPLIKKWQYFLIGQGYHTIVADGEFGIKTDTASRNFQKLHGLFADGVVGNETFQKAMSLGFQLVADPEDETRNGPNWPPPPDFRPLTQSQIQGKFGKFDFRILPDKSSIQILGNWEAENMVSVQIPQLTGLPPYKPTRIRLHRLAAPKFQRLFSEWEKAGLRDKIQTFDGAFNPRLIRGSNTQLSCHAWGIAIDINVPWNGLGVVPALKGQKGSVRELVSLANKLGFYWGGHFQRKDGMHFELTQL